MAHQAAAIFPYQSEDDHWRKLRRLSELYHENSKVKRWNRQAAPYAKSDPIRRAYEQSRQRRQEECYELIQYGAKRYPRSSRRRLPAAPRTLQRDIGEVMWQRRSQRRFSGATLTLSQLGSLLFFGYGVTRYEDPQKQRYPRRTVPSGGGIYPLEIYVLAFEVSDLDPGVYHYDVYTHTLEQLVARNVREDLRGLLLHEELAQGSVAAVALSGVFERPAFKYGELSYRLILLEAGHVGQNLCLAATALGLGICPIAGFVEDDLNDLLGLDGVDESLFYLHAIGKVGSPSEQGPAIVDTAER